MRNLTKWKMKIWIFNVRPEPSRRKVNERSRFVLVSTGSESMPECKGGKAHTRHGRGGKEFTACSISERSSSRYRKALNHHLVNVTSCEHCPSRVFCSYKFEAVMLITCKYRWDTLKQQRKQRSQNASSRRRTVKGRSAAVWSFEGGMLCDNCVWDVALREHLSIF